MIEQAVMDKYIQESTLKMNEKSKNNIRALLTKFFSLKSSVELNGLTKDDLIEMLSAPAIMSVNNFYAYKSKINDFMKWMYEEGHISRQVLQEFSEIKFSEIDRSAYYNIFYFKDLDDLIKTMNTVFSKRESEFDTFKSAAILVWLGIDIKNIPEILKSDFDDDERTIIDPSTKEKIPVPANAGYLISEYKHSTSYSSKKLGGTQLFYMDSKYLFRSYKNAYFTAKQLINISSSANRVAEEYKKVFQWQRIYLSGFYYRIYNYEQQHGEIDTSDFELLSLIFRESGKMTPQYRLKLSRKYAEYKEFKEYMYS